MAVTTTSVGVSAELITDVDGLDPIHVFWQNLMPGSGYCTICCYGSAWTVYFGGMAGRTIQQFFADADVDYLVGKLGITPHLKNTKRDQIYLAKIIRTVKRSLQSANAEKSQPTNERPKERQTTKERKES
jgi:hypothetical protein